MNNVKHFTNELKHGWFICPNVIARSKLPPTAKAVWMYIASQDDGWDFSARRIAKALRMSKDTVNNALNELQHWNLLDREKKVYRDKKGKIKFSACNYTLKNPEMNKELVPRKPLNAEF